MRNIVKKERLRIPAINWKNYDKEMELFIKTIETSPERFSELTAVMWNRIKQYQLINMSHLPIDVPHQRGETVDHYVDRFYVESGYSKGV